MVGLLNSGVYRSFVGTWSGGNSASDPTSDTSGKLKISRFGNTIHMYYWNDSSWVSHRDNTEYVSGTIEISLLTATENACSITVDYDNFVRYAVL